MYPLPIPLLLPIKNRIFILRPHLLLPRHLRLPPLNLLHGTPLLLQRRVHARNDAVDSTQAFALTGFLVGGETPGDFPGKCSVREL